MDYAGIYKITCLGNNKVYIGSAVWIKKRWSSHRTHLRQNIHHNPHLQNAFNLYGEKSFVYEVIEKCKKEKLIDREQYWIDKYNAFDKNTGFNVIPKADRSVMSEETKRKISLANKGRKKSAETRARMKAAQQNRSKEWCKNIGEGKLGHSLSEAHKKAISIANKGKHKLGHPLSEACKKAISIANKGKHKLGHSLSEAHKKALSVANKGKSLTQEHKNKIRSAVIKRWEKMGQEYKNKMRALLLGKPGRNRRKCMCIDTAEVFESFEDAAKQYHITSSAIRRAINKNGKCRKKRWKYLEERERNVQHNRTQKVRNESSGQKCKQILGSQVI